MLRQFELVRSRDPSGVTGTGVVAVGVQFPDGWVAVQWVNSPNPVPQSCPSLERLLEVHGHGGLTTIRWSPLTSLRGAYL